MPLSELPIDPDTGRPLWRGLPVPWIARWSNETALDTPMHAALIDNRLHLAVGPAPTNHPLGIRAGYRAQRDELGLLWQPDHDAPGSGVPEFATLHARRQRACMIDGLCQVCGRPFGDQSVTFLDSVMRKPRKPGRPLVTLTAPTCRGCAAVAMVKCPAHRRARDKRVIVVAHAYRPYAVLGDVFGYNAEQQSVRLERPRHTIHLDDALISRTLAKQLYVEVTDYTEEPTP